MTPTGFRPSPLQWPLGDSGAAFAPAPSVSSITGAAPFDAVAASGADPLAAIDWGTQTAARVLDVFFVPGGYGIDGAVTVDWLPYEIQQVRMALDLVEATTALEFRFTSSPVGADFQLLNYDFGDPGYLGWMFPPGEEYEGVGAFNHAGIGWEWDRPGTGALERGGFGFVTILHEIGHGLGLANPHDDGGTSTVMEGVTSPLGSYGVGDLNQGVFTTMSYNAGWPTSAEGAPPIPSNYGNEGGMMALDIAVLQAKYGANMATATGDDVYVLPDANARGTFFESIWDAGGRDTIRHDGLRDATIDLRAATLLQEAGGGGFVSHAAGVRGGFTVAHGVTIEDARGGGGADTLTGNAAANLLAGRKGHDTLAGGAGRDTIFGGDGDDLLAGQRWSDRLFGGAGRDELRGGQGRDTVDGGGGGDTIDGGAHDDRLLGAGGTDLIRGGDGADLLSGGTFGDTLVGGAGGDTMAGDDGSDVLRGFGGRDLMFGGDGFDTLYGGLQDDTLDGGERGDLLLGRAGSDHLLGNVGWDTLFGDAGGDTLEGGVGADRLSGNDGDDLMLGGDHGDLLRGHAGQDTLWGGKGHDTVQGGVGDDRLGGGSGRDLLSGGTGADRLAGGRWADTLEGGGGPDVLIGGAGPDAFVFTGRFGRDGLRDFDPADDTVQIDEVASLAAFLAASGDDGAGNLVYDLNDDGANVITFLGLEAADLGPDNFVFL